MPTAPAPMARAAIAVTKVRTMRWRGMRAGVSPPVSSGIAVLTALAAGNFCRYAESRVGRGRLLMPEVSHPGEDHRDAVLVGRGHHLGIAHAAPGLDHGARAGLHDDVEAVAKRKERIRGDHRAAQR